MEWYVLNYDFNKRVAYNFNIFKSSKFTDRLKKILTEQNDIKEEINNLLRYCFWSKTEYEIYVTDAFHEEASKIDVYSQVAANLDAFVDYILNNKEKILLEN